MPTTTLSSKYQITIPMEIVRSLGLKPGDKLAIAQIEERIVILKEPASWVDYFRGASTKGIYGSTKEEINRYIAEVRQGWEIDGLKNALAQDAELRAVYDATSLDEARSLSELATKIGVDPGAIDKKLIKLEELDAVKRLEHPTDKTEPYVQRIS